MLTEKDIEQVEDQGLTIEVIEQQLEYFRKGFPSIRLIAPAIAEKGIKILTEEDETRMTSVFENSLSTGLTTIKFVPASGAASRMFKNLFNFLEKATDNETADSIV